MLTTIKSTKAAKEGYVYVSYGHPKYLRHAVASVVTLRRYDKTRPVALCCSEKQQKILKEKGVDRLFDIIHILPEEHASIVGFKHNVYHYLFFERNIFLDSDIVWCKDPEAMWRSLHPFEFTITGMQISDNFFGATKGVGILFDILLNRRKRTLKHFGLTYLNRVQSGVMYAADYETTKKVCVLASDMLDRKDETHFQSRKMEQGRSEESCEWSLAMAMSKLSIPIFPWLNGHHSLQLDFISVLTEYDPDFEYVSCKYYTDEFVYSFRGLKWTWMRKLLFGLASVVPRKGDYLLTTPFCLHFGWLHDKQPFYSFSEKNWHHLVETASAGVEQDNRALPSV
ncbi:MAG: hypothetical protein AAFW89_14770 [Bacteroidota bacterium]